MKSPKAIVIYKLESLHHGRPLQGWLGFFYDVGKLLLGKSHIGKTLLGKSHIGKSHVR